MDADVFRIAAAAIIYAPLSIAWWIWTNIDRRTVAEAQWRIFAANCFDVTMVALIMAIADGAGAPMFLLYLVYYWIILGNGLRFGRPHSMPRRRFRFSAFRLPPSRPTLALGVGLTLVLIGGLVMVRCFSVSCYFAPNRWPRRLPT